MTFGSLRSGLGIVLAGLLLASCSNSTSSNGDLANAAGTPPTVTGLPSSVALSSTGNSLGPSSSTIITATVTDDAGSPLENITVTLSILTGSGLGTLSPATSTTDLNGVATTTFTSGTTAGLIQIQGLVTLPGGTTRTGVLSLSISNIGSAQLVGADPGVIGLQGSGQVQASTVTFKVVDQLANPVPDTTSITFSISGPGGGETFFPAVTNTSNGFVSVVVTSGTTPGLVAITVTATLGLTTISNTIIPLSIGLPPSTVELSSTGASLGPSSSTTITATVKDAAGIPVDNASVSFSIISGTGLGSLNPLNSTTDSNGIATTTLTSGAISGLVQIQARVPVQLGTIQSVVLPLSIVVPTRVELSSTGASLGPSSSSTISAIVTDAFGNPAENTSVTFSIITGTGLGTLNPLISNTDSKGIATTTFTTGTTPGLVQIRATVTVQSGTIQSSVLSLSISNLGSVQLVGAVPAIIGVQGSGQVQSSTVTFKVADQFNNPVPDTTSITFSISGPGAGETFFPTVTNTANGFVSVVISSGTKAGPVSITVLATLGPNSISNTMTPLSIGGGIPDQNFLSLGPITSNLGAGAPFITHLDVTTTLECKMADIFQHYNILQGTSVAFFTEAGAINAANATAGPDGVAKVVLRTQNPPPDVVNTSPGRHPENGRVTVMCETGGQEHFEDNNSNGIFDSGDTFTPVLDDITEPFLDRNESATRDDGTLGLAEYFDDVNQNGSWDIGNGVWDAQTKIWSPSFVVFSGYPENLELATSGTAPVICVSDVNGNAIMGGSTIELSVADPNTIIVPGTGQLVPASSATFTIPDQLFPNTNPDTLEPAGTCISFFPSSPGIDVTALVTWKVPGFSDQVNANTFTLP